MHPVPTKAVKAYCFRNAVLIVNHGWNVNDLDVGETGFPLAIYCITLPGVCAPGTSLGPFIQQTKAQTQASTGFRTNFMAGTLVEWSLMYHSLWWALVRFTPIYAFILY